MKKNISRGTAFTRLTGKAPCRKSCGACQLNPDQPRKEFDQESLQQLADSIREVGLLQPILVTEDRAATAS